MAGTPSPPESPLSSMDTSDAYDEDMHDDDDEETFLRPPKRIKVSGSTASPTGAPPARDSESHHRHNHEDIEPEVEHEAEHEVVAGLSKRPPLSDVSSDTSGDVPSSPIGGSGGFGYGGGGGGGGGGGYGVGGGGIGGGGGNSSRFDEDDFQEQVTVCAWDGCDAGDLGDLDELVKHIHLNHIENRQKRYTCEWMDCQRKSFTHASGYALKAHMRKHTREKPFFCYLPECDRSFTRSDALAKHMRTVHETEALRPSDPVPKSMQGSTGASISTGKSAGTKLKIIIKTPQSHATGRADSTETDRANATAGDENAVNSAADDSHSLTTEHGFTEEELALPLPRLFRRCRRQLLHAEEQSAQLQGEVRKWEDAYLELWREKEALLAQVVNSETGWHQRRQAVLAGAVDFTLPTNMDSAAVPKVEVDAEADAAAAAAAAEAHKDPDVKHSIEEADPDEGLLVRV